MHSRCAVVISVEVFIRLVLSLRNLQGGTVECLTEMCEFKEMNSSFFCNCLPKGGCCEEIWTHPARLFMSINHGGSDPTISLMVCLSICPVFCLFLVVSRCLLPHVAPLCTFFPSTSATQSPIILFMSSCHQFGSENPTHPLKCAYQCDPVTPSKAHLQTPAKD